MKLGSTNGMTLLEIMVVIVIIGLIGGLVGVAVFNSLNKAKIRATLIQIGEIQQACELYRLDFRKYPTQLAELINPPSNKDDEDGYLASLPIDPWGNPFQYRNPGQRKLSKYDIWSYGRDEVDGSNDDLFNEERNYGK